MRWLRRAMKKINSFLMLVLVSSVSTHIHVMSKSQFKPYVKPSSNASKIEHIKHFMPHVARAMVENRSLGGGEYGTHMAPLLTAVAYTTGPILELGCGDYSTPLLHALCSKTHRFLLSADTDKKWLHLFMDLENWWHQFKYVPVYEDDWERNPKPHLWDEVGAGTRWGVVLIDHRPGERRAVDIKRLKDQADILVVHDAQELGYNYASVMGDFKYRYLYKRYSTQTLVLSNVIDVAALFN
jgi:hypothetical protein